MYQPLLHSMLLLNYYHDVTKQKKKKLSITSKTVWVKMCSGQISVWSWPAYSEQYLGKNGCELNISVGSVEIIVHDKLNLIKWM